MYCMSWIWNAVSYCRWLIWTFENLDTVFWSNIFTDGFTYIDLNTCTLEHVGSGIKGYDRSRQTQHLGNLPGWSFVFFFLSIKLYTFRQYFSSPLPLHTFKVLLRSTKYVAIQSWTMIVKLEPANWTFWMQEFF